MPTANAEGEIESEGSIGKVSGETHLEVPSGSHGPSAVAVGMLRDTEKNALGESIAQARTAAHFIIRDLPTDGSVTFNMYMFGSSHSSFSSTCRRYTPATDRRCLVSPVSSVSSA